MLEMLLILMNPSSLNWDYFANIDLTLKCTFAGMHSIMHVPSILTL